MAQLEMLEGNKAKLTIKIDADVFEKAIQEAYRKTGSRYTVQGFRKGKTPRKIIETYYGAGVFYEDAFDAVWGEAYDAAVEEHKLIPIDQPSLDINSIGKDGVEFTATVQLQPDVTLGAYKGLSVPKTNTEVTDADVDKALEDEREKQARFTDVERPAENGDRLLLDYSGSVDGEKFDGGTAEDQTLVLGSGAFIPGFEEQLVGTKAGEQKDITVTFPAEYHAENLAGKEAVFACNVKAVQVKELPEIDDDLIADISEFDTVADWKADKKAKMLEEKQKAAAVARENAAIDGACANATVDIPAVMIDRQVDYMVRDLEYRLSGSGLDMNTYCQYLGTTVDEMKKNFRPDAEHRVKMQLVIEAIVKAENLSASDEDMQAEIERYAEENGMVVEDLVAKLTEGDKNYFRERATVDKAVRLIADSAVETDEAPKAEEA
ncbi:MAG: trigger factor [Clostridia bacterium]|nr:trigger factor [Clostridia bacterium]